MWGDDAWNAVTQLGETLEPVRLRIEPAPYSPGPAIPTPELIKAQDGIDTVQEKMRTVAQAKWGLDRQCFEMLMSDINNLQLEFMAKYEYYQRFGKLGTLEAQIELQLIVDKIESKMGAAARMLEPVPPGGSRFYCS